MCAQMLPEGKTLKVDSAKCVKCGTCIAVYPQLFELAADGTAQVKKDANFAGKDVEPIKAACAAEAIVEA